MDLTITMSGGGGGKQVKNNIISNMMIPLIEHSRHVKHYHTLLNEASYIIKGSKCIRMIITNFRTMASSEGEKCECN